MTEKEDYEFAAKAAGYELDWYPSSRCDLVTKKLFGDVVKLDWQPKLNDGDSRRLAVDLQIVAGKYDNYVSAFVIGNSVVAEVVVWNHEEPNPYAAVRLAVWRAAVAIGRVMK